ncbi:MAG: EAL domain-containing protein [Lachnospiraceae bacterium]|nr:EAL domain-containing protein [Lachnospiraceae bacterium]
MAEITVIADILSVRLDTRQVPEAIKQLVHIVYLVTHNMATPLYVIYLMILTDTDYRLKGRTKVLFIIPMAVVITIALSNPFTHWLFYFDETKGYTRGILFPVLYVSVVIYMIHIIRLTVIYGRSLGLKSFIAISSLMPFMVAAVVIQFFRSDFLLEMFANSMSLLMLSMLVNRPEDIIDTDTGLGNKKACMEGIKRCLENGKPLELILINITNYSFLEGIVGYDGVTTILRRITNRFESTNHSNKYFSELYYMGDGKFVLEMDYRKFSKTTHIAHFINDVLKTPITINGMELGIDAVVCIARCPEDIDAVDSLIAFQNDLGSSYFTGEVLFASEVYVGNHYDLMRQIDSIIENALNKHLFEVYYQPIYSIHEDRFNSAEALIRLHDEHFGYISPEFFIPAAEKSGAIHRIGAFVLEEVCAFTGSPEFRDLGVDYIEVNLSATQCMRSDLYKEILGILRKYNVEHHRINLEITETAAASSQDSLVENMRKLESRGLTFSLDDYGTGYSNMDRVSNMNFEIIKLDKSFVNVQRNLRRDIVLDNTVNMIKDLGMKIVVEGVENAEILQRFADLGCDYIQGFFFSKPLPKQEFIKYIKTHNR